MSSESRYKKLFSNTIIFAIGSFSSKILVLFLVPIYTNALTQDELGIADLLQQISNWLVPIVSLTVSEAITRFGLDKAYNKNSVFTIGTVLNLAGLAVLALVILGFMFFGNPDPADDSLTSVIIYDNGLILLAYVFTASLKLLFSYFVRAIEMVKLYAFVGILTTFFTLAFTVLLLLGLKIGVTGYLLAIILSDLIAIIYMFFRARLWKYFSFKDLDRSVTRQMLAYCVPLIPTQIMWLITNTSSSLIVSGFIGTDANGILSAAYKIPNLVSTVYMIFALAWNMSAVLEKDSDEQERFYENVFECNQSVIYILSAFILLFLHIITGIWIGSDFRSSVSYAPILIYATIFTCFVTFLGTIYSVHKKSVRSLVTALISGGLNIIINLAFVKIIGIYSAAVAALISYLAVFVIRAVDTKKYQPFNLHIKKLIFNCSVLAVMCLATYLVPLSFPFKISAYAILIAGTCVIVLSNFKCVMRVVKIMMPDKILRKIPIINKF